MRTIYKSVVAIFLVFFINAAHGQSGFVTITNCPKIQINSGNPAFPFPQFLEYAAGKTLAKHNAEGVTHADMEKTMREAYEIMTHRCRLTGETHCGVPYITFNHGSVPHNFNTFVSEGDGYILIAAAMFADQPTFNGLWMWIHDNRMSKVKKYKDCINLRPSQKTGEFIAGWQCDETTPANDGSTHSATDGDFDIAMGLLLAYRQWGEFMYQNGTQVKDACGNPISYKESAERAIKALVDTIPDYMDNGAMAGYMSGVIGVDGYVKSGNTWGELTMWRATQNTYPWANSLPTLGGNYGTHYFDYNAPSYFNEFAYFLENECTATQWQINQFKRAEASSDWLIGQAYQQGHIASIGKVFAGANNTFTFGSFNSGEDFRCSWRTILNYLWHGNPTETWDPAIHQVKAGTNSFEKDMAVRHAAMLKEPKDGGSRICKKMGASPDPGQPMWWGVAQIPQSWDLNGTIMERAGSNYTLGTGATAAVASEDLEFIADMYRQSELVWDDASTESKNLTDDQRYIQSTPKYFHGINRILGLLTNSGNLHAPRNMVPAANVKVYMSVDKSYAYQGDLLKYTVSYRNYGTLEATGVTLTTPLDADYTFVSASDGGTLVGNSIVWNVGKIPGFKSGGLAQTMDSVTFVVRITDLQNKRVCLQSTISGTNFESWVSNEFPNRATYTMERNCVDVLANRTLKVAKSTNRAVMNPQDIIRFTVDFKNESSEDSWLNGGRSNVYMSYGNFLPSPNSNADYDNTSFYQFYRFWHDGAEAYINMNNYRVSYFMNDINKGFKSATNPNGWLFGVDNQNDMDKYGYNPPSGPITFEYQKIPAGSDEHGSWNQRIMIQFADVLSAATTHVYDKLDSKYLLHKGVFGPGFIRSRLYTDPATSMKKKVDDDWSYDIKLQNVDLAAQGSLFLPISPGWADYSKPGLAINNYARHSCSPDVDNYDRILVEEFDGYTWRRIQGRGPLPGKEAVNVTIVDTIPKHLKWRKFVDSLALGVQATYTAAPTGANYSGIVKWIIPEMLVGETGNLIYEVVAADIGCPGAADVSYINAAWISSQTDSPDSSSISLTTTCTEQPQQIDPQMSLFKTANKKKVLPGESISYKLKYVNTDGTVVVGNMTTQTGWKKLANGNIPKAQATNFFSTDQNANPSINPPYFFANEKSYGINGYLETTWDVGNSSDFYLVFRYESGTPYQADFKGICLKVTPIPQGQGTIKFEVLDGTKVVATETSNVSYPTNAAGSFFPIEFKIKLQDTKMFVFVNDTETVLKSYPGLVTTKAGYVGVYSGPSGNQQKMIAFKTAFDHAFDVKLFDNLPVELGNITSISNLGAWDQTKKTITWPIVPGPIPYNDSLVYTFNAEALTCNKFINNLGLATVYGKDTLKVLNVIACGSNACTPPTSVSLTWSKSRSLCAGDSVKVTAKQTGGGTGTYNYQLIKDGANLGSTNTTGVFWVKAAGKYAVKATIAGDTCNKTSATDTVMVNDIPTLTASASDTVCKGMALKDVILTFKGTAPWSVYIDGTKTTVATSPYTITPTVAHEYVFTKWADAYCTDTVDTISVARVVKALPIASLDSSRRTYCGTISDVTLNITAPATATFAWSDGTNTVNATGGKTFTNAPAGTYSVTVTDNGCDTTLTGIKVTALPAPTYEITGGGDTCEGNTLPKVRVVASTKPFDYYLKGSTTKLSSTDSILIISPTTAMTYRLDSLVASNGCKATDNGDTARMRFLDTPTVTITIPPGVCNNDSLKLTATSIPAGGTFRWTGTAVDTTGWLSGLKAAGTSATVTVTNTSSAGCVGIATGIIPVWSAPVLELTPDTIQICKGDQAQINASYTLGQNPVTYSWTNAGTDLTNNNTNDPKTVNTLAKGSYSYELIIKDNNSCSDTITQYVVISEKEKPTFTLTKSSVCEPDDAIDLSTMVSPAGGVFKVGGKVISNSLLPASFASKFVDTTITIYYVIGTGDCKDSSWQMLTINRVPLALFVNGNKTKYCSYDTVTALAYGYDVFSVFSITGPGIVGTSFDPTASGITKDKDFYIYIEGTKNGCVGRDSLKVRVNSRPVVTLTGLETQYCVDSEADTLSPRPWDATTSVLSSTLAGSLTNDSIFDPAKATASNTAVTLTYSYSDPTTGCGDTVEAKTTIYKTDAPTVTSASITLGEPAIEMKATGTDLTWYDSTRITVVATGVDAYKSTETGAGEYKYHVSQTVNGCTSPLAEVLFTISDCPLSAPVAASVRACAGSDATARTLSVTTNGADEYRWYKANAPVHTGASYPVAETAAGVYDFTVAGYNTAQNCLSGKTSVRLTIVDTPTVVIAAPAELCANSAYKPITATLSADSTGGTFSGTGVSGTTFTAPASAGTSLISYTFTSKTGCVGRDTATIVINALPAASIAAVPALCSNGKAVFIKNTGTPAATASSVYSLLTATTAALDGDSLRPGTAGTIVLAYEHADARGCVDTAWRTIVVDATPAPAADTTGLGLLCSATTTAVDLRSVFTPTGGVLTGDGVTASTMNFTPSTAGDGNHELTYTVTNAANASCVASVKTSVKVDKTATITFPAVGPLCYDDPDSLTTLAATADVAGTGVYTSTALYSTGKFNARKASTTAANEVVYTFATTAGCSSTAKVSVTVNKTAPPTTAGDYKLVDNIPPAPTLTATGTGIKWYKDSTRAAAAFIQATGTYDVPDNAIGTYTYWATQTIGGCESQARSASATVASCLVPAPAATSATFASWCQGKAAKTFTAAQSATCTGLRWYDNAQFTGTAVATGPAFTPTAGGTYYAVQDSGGCPNRTPRVFTAVVNPLPVLAVESDSAHACVYHSPISIKVTSTENGTVAFSTARASALSSSTPGYAARFDPALAGAGTHVVTCVFTTDSSCAATVGVTIEVDSAAPPAVARSLYTDLTLNPVPALVATGTGLRWYYQASSSAAIGSGSPFVDPAVGEDSQVDTTYLVTQSVGGCESHPAMVRLVIRNCGTPAPAAGDTSVCFGSVVPALAATGTKLNWYGLNDTTPLAAEGTASFATGKTSVGFYAYRVTQKLPDPVSGIECEGPAATVVLGIKPLPTVDITTADSILCLGDSTTLSAVGSSVAFRWGNSATATSGSLRISPATTTTYTVTGTSANGCSSTDSVVVEVNVPPVATVTPPLVGVCPGGVVTLQASASGANVTASTTYEWGNGKTTPGITETPSGGPYAVVVTDGKGCSDTAEAFVTVKPLPAVALSGDSSICVGQSASITATGDASGYRWSTGSQSASVSLSPATSTRYTVTATLDGCESTADVTVVVHALPVVTIDRASSEVCRGDALSVTASGAQSYTWVNNSGGDVVSPGASLVTTPVADGSYTVTGVDGNGCPGSATATVRVRELPPVAATEKNNVTVVCRGEQVTLVGTGAGVGGVYEWDNGVVDNQPFAPQSSTPTTYTVRGTDAGGCFSFATITVIANPLPHVTAISSRDLDRVCEGGSIALMGQGADSYQWSGGLFDGQPFVPLASATYTVTGTSPDGCTGTASITVEVNGLPTVTVTPASPSVCDGDLAVLTASGALSYRWNTGATSNPLRTTAPGWYTVTGTDANECEDTASVMLAVLPVPDVSATASVGYICVGDSVVLAASGAASYRWNTGHTGSWVTMRPGDSTTYTVTGTASNGCTSTAVVSVGVADTVAPPQIIDPSSCFGSEDASLLTWQPLVEWLDEGGRLVSRESLERSIGSPGTYYFSARTVEDGCRSTLATLRYVSLPAPSPVISGADSLCEGSYRVPYSASPAGDQYEWSVSGRVVNYSIGSDGTHRRAVDWIIPGIDTVSVTGTSPDGCRGTATKIVRVAPLPVTSFEYGQGGQEGVVSFFSTSSQPPISDGVYTDSLGLRLTWNFGRPGDTDETHDSAGTPGHPLSKRFEYGEYSVTLVATNELGCSVSQSLTVAVDISTGVFVPNAICPTCPSEELREFRPRGFNMESYKLSVYDTWGNMLWYSTKLSPDGTPQEAWDGTYNGQLLKADTYVWRMEVVFKDGSTWNNKSASKKKNRVLFGNVVIIQ